MLPEIFKGCAGRYGEQYYKFSLQTNEYEKGYCVLWNNWVLWPRPSKIFDAKLHNSKAYWSMDEIFRINVPRYEKLLWNFLLQKNMKKVLAYKYVNPHPVHSLEWSVYA